MRLASLSVLCAVAQLVGLALFLAGFFPVRRSLPGHADPARLPPEPGASSVAGSPPQALEPAFGRVVLVLVDALRADFVFGAHGATNMPYTHAQAHGGHALRYTARAHPPTVTMPRIKALTSGSIPGFLDLLMNLEAVAAGDDTFLWQALAAGRRLRFYGDDTWLRLFPGTFHQAEGTTSFFVTDHTEVDTNVTRHVPAALASRDWQLLVLHYLGLDHIGHTHGPASALVPHKLREMDAVVRAVHTALLREDESPSLPALLVLCGDHGMSNAGSHGGSSEEELLSPLLLFSSAFPLADPETVPAEVLQVDLAATLSLGMGRPVPLNSMGHVITAALEHRPIREQLRALQANAHQLAALLRAGTASYATEPGYLHRENAERWHESWLRQAPANGSGDAPAALAALARGRYVDALRGLSRAVTRDLARYDTRAMAAGGATVLLALVLLVVSAWACGLDGGGGGWGGAVLGEVRVSAPVFWVGFAAVLAFVVTANQSACSLARTHGREGASGGERGLLCSWPLPAVAALLAAPAALVAAATAIAWTRRCSASSSSSYTSSVTAAAATTVGRRCLGRRGSRSLAPPGWAWLGGIAAHTASLASSSFVEEEHLTWYYLGTSLLAVMVARQAPLPTDDGDEGDGDGGGEGGGFDESGDGGGGGGGAGWSGVAALCGVAVAFRLLRSWNQTGVQWVELTDIGDWLRRPEQEVLLRVLAGVACACLCACLCSRCPGKACRLLVLLGLAALAHVHVTLSDGVTEARAIAACAAGVLLSGAVEQLRHRWCILGSGDGDGSSSGVPAPSFLAHAIAALTLILAALMRPHNLPVLALWLLMQAGLEWLLSREPGRASAAHVALTYHCLGQAAFYQQGNSNGLASVDVAAGYVGQRSHSGPLAVLLTAACTFTGPITWAAAVAATLQRVTAPRRLPGAVDEACAALALARALPLVAYLALAAAQRYHLFIWSVFSPKLLYEAAQTAFAALVLVALRCLA
uniref:GPI ethanolamine phosphate transferase 2 isoform X1 n=1 Tax=Petromyzon marinus TaxID=7757 RepID=A0AAJ7T1S3_PETMA|nr:GPI ethanolamine phosphate transferase 2 isoform X1 [Petromyzon marinus]